MQQSVYTLLIIALVALVAQARGEASPAAAAVVQDIHATFAVAEQSSTVRRLLQRTRKKIVDVHAKAGTEIFYSTSGKSVRRIKFVHNGGSERYTVTFDEGRALQGQVNKHYLPSIHKFAMVANGRTFIFGSPSVLVEMNGARQPSGVYVAPPHMPKGVTDQALIEGTYMTLAREVMDLYTEWTGLLIAGQSVPEFAGLTDWTILRMKFKNAFDAVETICETAAAEQRGNQGLEQNLLAMGRTAKMHYQRMNYWHEKMKKHGVSELDTPDVDAFTASQMRAAVFGNDGMKNAREQMFADVTTGNYRSRVDQENLNNSQGSNAAWFKQIGEVMPSSRVQRELAKGTHSGAQSIVDELFSTIDNRLNKVSERNGNGMYQTQNGGSDMRLFGDDETRRLTELKQELNKMDLTNKLSQTLYSNMIDTPWIKRAVSGLDTKWDNGDEWVSAKEKQLSAWAEKTGNYFKNLISGGEKVEAINADVEKEGGMVPGDKERASTAYAAAHAKKMKALQLMQKDINSPPSQTSTVSSTNPAKKTQKYQKTFRFRFKPKFQIGKNLISRVAITTDLTFSKANLIHHFDFDVIVHDPLDKDKQRATVKLAYTGANAKGYSWGASANALINGSVAQANGSSAWDPYGAKAQDGKESQLLMSTFIRYRKNNVDMGMFISLKVPIKVKNGVVNTGTVARISPYFRYTFPSQRTEMRVSADVYTADAGVAFKINAKLSHEFSNGWYGDLSAGHTMNPGGGSSTYGEMTIRKQYDLGRNGANMAIEGYAGVRHNDGVDWNAPSSNSFKPSGGMVGIRLKISF